MSSRIHRATLLGPILLGSALTTGCNLPSPEPREDGLFEMAAGFEVQGYPAGVIYGAHGQIAIDTAEVITVRAAVNDTDRQDFGEFDNEEGDGIGGGVGYRRYYGGFYDGWMWGARVDLWDLEIDWREDPGLTGTTDILVLQPTVEAGYTWWLDELFTWRLTVSAAVGAEINIDTDGEDVGEGAMGLLGLTLTRTL